MGDVQPPTDEAGDVVGVPTHRPWGTYTVLADEADHKVKRLVVASGQKLSYQRHQFRDEHWFVVAGCGAVTLDDAVSTVAAGANVDVPRGTAHRLENTGDAELVLIEVQTGVSFDEGDIERLDDIYGRAN